MRSQVQRKTIRTAALNVIQMHAQIGAANTAAARLLISATGLKDGLRHAVLKGIGDYGRAAPLLRESLTLCREIGDRWLTAYPTRILGIVAANQGDYEVAKGLLEESLALERELGDKWGTAQSQSTLGYVAFNQKNYMRAMTLLNESLVLRKEVGSKPGIAECLERLGTVAGGLGQLERAAPPLWSGRSPSRSHRGSGADRGPH
jgi:hypothetical protein